MKMCTIRRILIILLWVCIGALVYGRFGSNTPNVAAREPLNLIPLSVPPIAQNDAYGTNQNTTLSVASPGVLGNDTDLDSTVITATLVSNPSHGAVTLNGNGSFSYTPNSGYSGTDSFSYVANDGTSNSNVGVATIEIRSVAFRADVKEITQGNCVLFSWVVRGDISIVEFERQDDGKDPILVAGIGDRQDCPEKDARYQLIVRWLDGTSDKNQKIDIGVESAGSSDSSSSSSTSSTVSGVTVVQPGSFVMVTPILITNAPGSVQVQVTPTPVAYNNTVQIPKGVLGSITSLPETGVHPPSSAHQVQPNQPIYQVVVRPSPQKLLDPLSAKMGLLLGVTIIGLSLAVKSGWFSN